MGEYIERELLMKHEHEVTLLNGAKHRCIDADAVLEVPKSDVVEVRHGEWRSITDYGNGNCFGYCSACGKPQKAESATALKLFFKYCRNCGAKMDGKGEG